MELYANISFPNNKNLHILNAVLDEQRYWLPECAGIYFVFVGKAIRENGGFRMPDPRLIYIGESKNIYERHNTEEGTPNHEHYSDFIAEKQPGEEIAYAFAKVEGNQFARRLIESALIYRFKPTVNIKSKYTFFHRNTTIEITSDIQFPFTGTIDVEASV